MSFTYYKDSDITSIYDCSVIGRTNKYIYILSTIYMFTPVRPQCTILSRGRGRLYNAVKTALSLRYKLFCGVGSFPPTFKYWEN